MVKSTFVLLAVLSVGAVASAAQPVISSSCCGKPWTAWKPSLQVQEHRACSQELEGRVPPRPKEVPFRNRYYIALKAKGVPVEMHLYPSGGHGFGTRTRNGTVDGWLERMAEWIKLHAVK